MTSNKTRKQLLLERGSMMVEAIAMLGLISMVSPMLFKQTRERQNELADITVANQTRALAQAANDYIKANYKTLVDPGVNQIPDGGSKMFTMTDLQAYLPPGVDATSNAKNAIIDEYRVGIRRQGSRLTAMLAGKGTMGVQPLPKIRTSRIASMIGSQGGYGRTDGKVSGSQGSWMLDANQYFDTKTWDPGTGSVFATTSYDGASSATDYLHRNFSGDPALNTMYTTLFMNNNDINGIKDAIVNNKVIAKATTNEYSELSGKQLDMFDDAGERRVTIDGTSASAVGGTKISGGNVALYDGTGMGIPTISMDANARQIVVSSAYMDLGSSTIYDGGAFFSNGGKTGRSSTVNGIGAYFDGIVSGKTVELAAIDNVGVRLNNRTVDIQNNGNAYFGSSSGGGRRVTIDGSGFYGGFNLRDEGSYYTNDTYSYGTDLFDAGGGQTRLRANYMDMRDSEGNQSRQYAGFSYLYSSTGESQINSGSWTVRYGWEGSSNQSHNMLNFYDSSWRERTTLQQGNMYLKDTAGNTQVNITAVDDGTGKYGNIKVGGYGGLGQVNARVELDGRGSLTLRDTANVDRIISNGFSGTTEYRDSSNVRRGYIDGAVGTMRLNNSANTNSVALDGNLGTASFAGQGSWYNNGVNIDGAYEYDRGDGTRVGGGRIRLTQSGNDLVDITGSSFTMRGVSPGVDRYKVNTTWYGGGNIMQRNYQDKLRTNLGYDNNYEYNRLYDINEKLRYEAYSSITNAGHVALRDTAANDRMKMQYDASNAWLSAYNNAGAEKLRFGDTGIRMANNYATFESANKPALSISTTGGYVGGATITGRTSASWADGNQSFMIDADYGAMRLNNPFWGRQTIDVNGTEGKLSVGAYYNSNQRAVLDGGYFYAYDGSNVERSRIDFAGMELKDSTGKTRFDVNSATGEIKSVMDNAQIIRGPQAYNKSVATSFFEYTDTYTTYGDRFIDQNGKNRAALGYSTGTHSQRHRYLCSIFPLKWCWTGWSNIPINNVQFNLFNAAGNTRTSISEGRITLHDSNGGTNLTLSGEGSSSVWANGQIGSSGSDSGTDWFNASGGKAEGYYGSSMHAGRNMVVVGCIRYSTSSGTATLGYCQD